LLAASLPRSGLWRRWRDRASRSARGRPALCAHRPHV